MWDRLFLCKVYQHAVFRDTTWWNLVWDGGNRCSWKLFTKVRNLCNTNKCTNLVVHTIFYIAPTCFGIISHHLQGAGTKVSIKRAAIKHVTIGMHTFWCQDVWNCTMILMWLFKYLLYVFLYRLDFVCVVIYFTLFVFVYCTLCLVSYPAVLRQVFGSKKCMSVCVNACVFV